MKYTWNYLLIMIWLGYLLSSGIYLFSKGYLLSRNSKSNINNCYKFGDIKCREDNCNPNFVSSEILKNMNSSSDVCLPKKSKVIFLLIDALKYDFGPFNLDNENPLPYENKLPVFNKLLRSSPEKSRLVKFIADPPTTTMQRLKGITTGTLPTFVDVGSNFATPEINEDNIIDQIVQNNLSVVFMGDSTWTDLFPKRFKREYSYHSFNIYDLDTVDNKIAEHLPKEVGNNDWDLLIAHFLGVDHCGHKYGPMHSEMSRKLNDMNEMIENVIEQMANDTVLIVAGDHGMTFTGDHGGDSTDEINALLFLYSKGTDLISEVYNLNGDTMQQIDFVPTLSSILGIPIPYSNLGTVQYHMLPDKRIDGFLPHQMLLFHGWQNTIQVYNYFKSYSSENSDAFDADSSSDLDKTFTILSYRANSIYTDLAFRSFAKDLNIFLKEILSKCRELWINFDANLMAKGLFIVFSTVFSFFLMIFNLSVKSIDKIFNKNYLFLIYLTSIGGYPVGYILNSFLTFELGFKDILFYSCGYSIAIVGFVIISNWSDITEKWHRHGNFSSKLLRIIFIMFVTIFFSNSYIIEEQKVLNYLLIGLIFISLNEINFNFKKNFKEKKRELWKYVLVSALAIIALRISYNLFKCREEQQGCLFKFEELNQNPLLKNKTSSKKAATIFDFLPIVIMALFTSLSKMYIKNIGNLSGYSPHVIFFRYAPTVTTICIAGHFVLMQNPIATVRSTHIDGLAWVVYLLYLIHILIIIINPLLLFILPPAKKQPIRVYEQQNMVPELFNHIKNRANTKSSEEDKTPEIPVVYGLATVYSSVIIAFGVMTTLLFAMLLGSNPSIGLFIGVFVGVAISLLGGMLKGQTTEDLENFLQPRLITLISYLVLIHYTFYATSHQPTLSQIDWHAAFIGRSKYNDNTFISALLVLLNTFSSQILFLIVYPILVIMPIIINIVVTSPNVNTKDKSYDTINVGGDDMDFNLTRGELNLFEVDSSFTGSVFKTGCQLMILQGARVFCAMLACTIHCRHLMVWKIFAPRFMYEGISTYISIIAIILGYILVVRVHKKVETLVLNISKRN